MAKLILGTGTVVSNALEISVLLAQHGLDYRRFDLENRENLPTEILGKASLGDEEKNVILTHFSDHFEHLKSESGYQTQDLIVLHPEMPGIDELLKKFSPCHTHDDEEVRFIVDGEGVFGFDLPDQTQISLLVEAGDYVNVPAGQPHWFYLTQSRRIKAIRYFSTMEGWTPVYTNTPVLQVYDHGF